RLSADAATKTAGFGRNSVIRVSASMVRQQGESVGSAYVDSPCGGMRCYSPSGPGVRYTLNDLCTGRTYTVLLMRERADLLQFLIHQYHCVDWTCNGPRVQDPEWEGMW
ncbi:unnamed protein product, partial [Pylaiella littoralis]